MAEEIEEQEPTEVESLAMKLGWNPDHKGLDREFVDAETFIMRGREIQDTMRKQIKNQGTQITELGTHLSTGIENLRKHQEKVHKADVARLNTEIVGLRKERRAAVKEGDADLVDDLDGRIDDLKEAAKEEPIPTVVPTQAPNPDFVDWHEKNPWFQGNSKIHQEMTLFANTLADQNAGLPYSRMTAHIDTKMREHFPEQFDAPKKEPKVEDKKEEKNEPKVAAVESGGKKSGTKHKFTQTDLSDGQRKIMDELVKMKVITKEDYIQDLVDIGELR